MISDIYSILLKEFGNQGWWPILSYKGLTPTKTGSIHGYHPGNYTLPETRQDKFEVCVGAILAQNTSWPNAEKALVNLKNIKLLAPKKITEATLPELSKVIMPSGYYNQKARKLKIFAEFFVNLKGISKREDLLGLWGIGKETADSMLLYAYHEPVFVIDSYTRRIMNRMGFNESDYEELRKLFEENLPKDHKIFNELHALLVELAKRNCKKVPVCKGCALEKGCRKVF
jgi:endonuclease-3 related protein